MSGQQSGFFSIDPEDRPSCQPTRAVCLGSKSLPVARSGLVNTILDNGLGSQEILHLWRSFLGPGLLGPDGRALADNAQPLHFIVSEIATANDEYLQDIVKESEAGLRYDAQEV